MNKIGIVLGIAAVAVVAGCKDPNYRQRKSSQDEVKNTGTEIAPAQGEATHVVVIEEKHCTCPPGTKHTEPCACGADDCQCVVDKKEAEPPAPSPEPEYTIYIVQRGDYLAKISKKYNVTIDSIKRLNGMKDDKIRLGQKIKLPGKIDVGEQKVPEGAVAKAPKKAAKPYTPYSGPTREYVVKSGDTLGAIAYGNGISIRQLKELNGLKSDALKIDQKLKIPAGKVASAAPANAEPVAQEKPVVDETKPVADPVAPEANPAAVATVDQPVATPAQVEEPVSFRTYTVQEGDDLSDVTIRFGVTAAAIRELNNLGENDTISAGQVLKIPAGALQ